MLMVPISFMYVYKDQFFFVQLLNHVQLFATPWTITHEAPVFMGFSRQEHWSRLPCPPPGDLPDPGIEALPPASPALPGECYRATWEAQIPVAAAGAAESPQSCPTLCDPIDGSPPGSPVPGLLQARTLEWVAISFSSA